MIAGIAMLGALALAPAVAAQAPYISVHIDEIEPANSTAYEANGREWVAAFTEAGLGADQGWRGYTSDFTYAWVADMPNYAYMDGERERFAAAAAAVGEEKMAALEAGGSSRSHYTEVWKFEPEMSYLPEGPPTSGMTYINVGTHHVKPGMDDEYKAVVKDVVAALTKIKADAAFAGYSIALGRGSYAYVSWGADRGALHSGPEMGAMLVEALGPEGSREIWDRWTRCINGTEERDWAIRPELSFAGVAGGAGAGQ
jgi:hypothetical protein